MTEKLQNIASCEGGTCNEVPDEIANTDDEEMTDSVIMDESDYKESDNIEDFLI